MIIKKDTIFVLSCDEYSDYSIDGLFVALEDIDIEKIRKDFLKNNIPDEYGNEEYICDLDIKFLNFIKDKVKKIEYSEWHYGSYGRINEHYYCHKFK